MGIQAGISATSFPKQGSWLGRNVRVCFNHDASVIVRGVVVREDSEAPGLMILGLEDGRYVLSTECQFALENQ